VSWVPAQAQGATRRRSRSWVWAVAGCLTLVVLTTAGVGYGVYSYVQGVKNGSNTCLPSNFPRYPGAVYAGFAFDLNGKYPGYTCHATFQSNDDVAAVTAFYQSRLNTGDWQVTSIGEPAAIVTFQPTRSAAPFGTVQVAVSDGHTEITIDLYTSTCLPLGFPKYPGAGFAGQDEEVGATRACHVVFVSKAGVAAITAFYEKALNSGRWQVSSSSAGQISFRLTNGKRTDASGTVMFVESGERTEIRVETDT
jgi:hypothetical protein